MNSTGQGQKRVKMNNCALHSKVKNTKGNGCVSKSTKSFDVVCTKLVTNLVIQLTLDEKKGIFNIDLEPLRPIADRYLSKVVQGLYFQAKHSWSGGVKG